MSAKLLSEFKLGSMAVKNRIVMSPMTRCRATADHIPTAIMATYYAQRAEAGLLISEGIAPSPNGVGYARIPGLYNVEQTRAWRSVTDAVHKNGGRIFAQLMHTGRVSHPLNMPAGARVLAPSAIQESGAMWTDQQQMQPYPVPEAMTEGDIAVAVKEFTEAAANAIEAGFDGVELHGANGYLIDQFLNTASNQRTDRWGGSVVNRIRFAVEVTRGVAARIGAGLVGIRVSPYGAFNDMNPDGEMDELYTTLAGVLGGLGLAYIHIVDHSSQGAPEVKPAIKAAIRDAFKRPIVLSGGYEAARAEVDLIAGRGELVAFGRPFIANPDLVARIRAGAPLAKPDPSTFYTPGEKGYTDYPALEVAKV